jgi:hypothetical protein
MDSDRLDGLTGMISMLLSRRTLARALGFSPLALPTITDTQARKHKHKHKKVKFNAFGCVSVGNFCKNSDQCCSGICEGKKDKRKCKAHDQGTCQPGQDSCPSVTIDCTSSINEPGNCLITTGNASYCGRGSCFLCQKDADCVQFCGPQAACVSCAACQPDTIYVTACVGPAPDSCDFGP